MLLNLILGLSTMVLCLLLQTLLLMVVLRYYTRQQEQLSEPGFWSAVMVVKSIMVLLVAGNLGQIALWAILFLLLGEFHHYSEAFYHSAVNFATLGYGDVVMSESHRLLGPLEAINGALMIGVSTAALMSAFQDIIRKRMLGKSRDNDISA